jgi:hypothetical protein
MVGVGDLDLETACLTAIALNLNIVTATTQGIDLKNTIVFNIPNVLLIVGVITIAVIIVILRQYLHKSRV